MVCFVLRGFHGRAHARGYTTDDRNIRSCKDGKLVTLASEVLGSKKDVKVLELLEAGIE